MDDAKLSLKDLQEVVLVGGSTRIPGVQSLVKQMTGKSPNVTVNPDEVVALGAAVQVSFLLNPCSIQEDMSIGRIELCLVSTFRYKIDFLPLSSAG